MLRNYHQKIIKAVRALAGRYIYFSDTAKGTCLSLFPRSLILRKEMKMGKVSYVKTKVALDKSILHWKRMRDGEESIQNYHSNYCALCAEFIRIGLPREDRNKCKGCPVSQYTGKPLCSETPWAAYAKFFDKVVLCYPEERWQTVRREEVWEKANDMVEFLERVRRLFLADKLKAKLGIKDTESEGEEGTPYEIIQERNRKLTEELAGMADKYNAKETENIELKKTVEKLSGIRTRLIETCNLAWGKFHTVVRENNALRKQIKKLREFKDKDIKRCPECNTVLNFNSLHGNWWCKCGWSQGGKIL